MQSKEILHSDPIWIYISLLIDCSVEALNYSMLSLAFITSSFRFTEKNLLSQPVQSDLASFF